MEAVTEVFFNKSERQSVTFGGYRGLFTDSFIFQRIFMKYLIAFFLLAPLFFTSQDAHAMVKIDTMYANNIYSSFAIDSVQSKAALGKNDNQYATFGNSALLDLKFKNHAGTGFLVIKAKSTLWVWGKKDLSVDSSAGQIVFANDDNGFFTSKPFILKDGLNIIAVPDSDFTYVELSLATPDPHATKYAKSYLVDAVALLQDTTPVVSVPFKPLLVRSISSYPNPFIANTTIHFELEAGGDIELAVFDGLGREIDRVQAGYLDNGIHEIPLAIRTPGFYFVRLLVNGQPVGNPLKINSR